MKGGMRIETTLKFRNPTIILSRDGRVAQPDIPMVVGFLRFKVSNSHEC